MPRESHWASVGKVAFSPGDRVRDLGGLNLLSGQTDYLTARVSQNGRVHALSPDRLRRLMAQDPDTAGALELNALPDSEMPPASTRTEADR